MKSNEEGKDEVGNESGSDAKKKRRRFSRKKQKTKKKEEKVDEGATACSTAKEDDVIIADNVKEDVNIDNIEENNIDDGRNTLPRARRSRDTTSRRSFKDLFRKSSKAKLKKKRSFSTGELENEEDINMSDGNVAYSADYTKFNPILQPRDRLKYMTVKDALKERGLKKSPIGADSPFENQDNSNSRGSLTTSLPDLSSNGSQGTLQNEDETARKFQRSQSAVYKNNSNGSNELVNEKYDTDKNKQSDECNDTNGDGLDISHNKVIVTTDNERVTENDDELEIAADDEMLNENVEVEEKSDVKTSKERDLPLSDEISKLVTDTSKETAIEMSDMAVHQQQTTETKQSQPETSHQKQSDKNDDINIDRSIVTETEQNANHENKSIDPVEVEAPDTNINDKDSKVTGDKQHIDTESNPLGDTEMSQVNVKDNIHSNTDEQQNVQHENRFSSISSNQINSSSRDHSPSDENKEDDEDSEKQRRESFSRFMQLRDTLPHYSSSAYQLKTGDSFEDNHASGALGSITEKPVMADSDNTKPVLPDLPVMGTAEKLQLGSQTLAKDILSTPVDKPDYNSLTKKDETCQHTVGTVTNDNAEPAIIKSGSNTLTSAEPLKEPRRKGRGDYKSPRRFSGRSTSGGRKKDRNKTSEKDKTKQEGITFNQEDKNDETKSEDIPEKTKTLPLTSTSRGKRFFSTKSSKGTTAKPLMSTTGTQSESNLTRSNVLSRSIQTSLETLKIDNNKEVKKRHKGIQKELDDVAEVFTKEVFDISEISDVNKENSFFQPVDKTKRKASRHSSDTSGDKSAEVDVDDSVFKTPDSSPQPVRKVLPVLSELKIIDAEVQRSNTSCAGVSEGEAANEASISVDDQGADAEKDPKGEGKSAKISLLGIISLKRKLARQRSQREKKRRPSKSFKEKKQDSDKETNNKDEVPLTPTEAQKEADANTKVFIENETNLSLSKLALLQETDILDVSDDRLPKKHISFDGLDDPVTSDEPLEDDPNRPRRSLASRRESKILEKRRKVISCCKKFIAFLFSHIGLCSLVVAYSILGGFIFQALEAPFEKKTMIKVKNERANTLTQIVELAQELKLSKRSRENFSTEVNGLLVKFQTEVYTATEMYGWKNKDAQDESEMQWSFASSLLFAITVMTTIGYGHVAPKTDYGRIVTIGYAVLGIPLTLLCLTNIGDLMASGFRILYAKVCCGVCCVLFSPKKRRLPDPENGVNVEEEVVIREGEKSSSTVNVPTSLCILVMTAYILLGTLLFSIWEGWDVITGTYFSFITLSTIGFGDVVPGTATDQWANEQKLVLCAMYLVLGLSLIAMCFNLVQEDVKFKCRWLGEKIGII